MAAKYSRRPSHLSEPLSPSLIPELALLPVPLPTDSVPCGQLVALTSKHTPTTLTDRDYDDEALLGGAVVVCRAFAFAGVPLPPSALLSKIADLLPFKR